MTEETSLLRIKVHLKQGRKDLALHDARVLVSQHSDNAELWLLCHLISGEAPYLFKAYSLEPSSASILNALIAHYLKTKQHSKLVRAMRVAQGLDCLNPFVIGVLAVLQGKLDNVDEARVLISTSMLGAIDKGEMDDVARVVQALLRELLVGVLMGRKDELVSQVRGRLDADELILDNFVQRIIKSMADAGIATRDHFKNEIASLKERFEGKLLERVIGIEGLVFGKSEATVNALLMKVIETDNLTVKKLLILSIISKMAAMQLDETDFDMLYTAIQANIGTGLKYKALAALLKQNPRDDLIDELHENAPEDLKAISDEDFHKLVNLALIEPSMHSDFIDKLPTLRMRKGERDYGAAYNYDEALNRKVSAQQFIEAAPLALHPMMNGATASVASIARNPNSKKAYIDAVFSLAVAGKDKEARKLLKVTKAKMEGGRVV